MKIFCIGRNYSEHTKELNNETPESPVVFMKPATALLKDNQPFFYPEWTKDLHYETELVLRVCKQGKYIKEKFASTYYDQIGLGIDFTARDLQAYQKSKGLPWEIAKAFDNSAVISPLKSIEAFNKENGISFSMKKNGTEVQRGNSIQMLYSFDTIIVYISQFFTLQQGDLIYTGTPAGVGAVQIGDKLEGFLEEEKVFECEIK
ncbi:MAG: fumarylacetoacetate hydrolase family protein [Chitinophagales bacterium]|nr:fumarylacetoacetate hydrolase family protein [Chitinophagales bacterium]